MENPEPRAVDTWRGAGRERWRGCRPLVKRVFINVYEFGNGFNLAAARNAPACGQQLRRTATRRQCPAHFYANAFIALITH